MRIPALVVAISNDHLRSLGANDAHEPTDGFVDVGHVERRRVGIGGRLGHS
jgi:hypothetical protein